MAKGGAFDAIVTSKSLSFTSWNSLRSLLSCVKFKEAPLSASNKISIYSYISHSLLSGAYIALHYWLDYQVLLATVGGQQP